MDIIQIQFAPWDKKYNFNSGGLIDLKIGDFVVVETEFGQEVGKVFNFKKLSEIDEKEEEIKPIIRLAVEEDLNRLVTDEEKKEALDYCRKVIENYELPMKLVDVHFSLDRNRINFAFYSDSRVDFRNLVKDLSSHFKGIIRLTQIGSRDEAKVMGDLGHCGKCLCCRSYIKDFSSITSEMAEAQQVVHRGSDRVSGMCGKLMCCLSYEYEGYLELNSNLPPIGAKVNVDGRRGEVLAQHVLKQSVDVLFKGDKDGENDMVIEVDINRHKKNKLK